MVIRFFSFVNLYPPKEKCFRTFPQGKNEFSLKLLFIHQRQLKIKFYIGNPPFFVRKPFPHQKKCQRSHDRIQLIFPCNYCLIHERKLNFQFGSSNSLIVTGNLHCLYGLMDGRTDTQTVMKIFVEIFQSQVC